MGEDSGTAQEMGDGSDSARGQTNRGKRDTPDSNRRGGEDSIYERMGMKAATSEQVDKEAEHVAWRPDARKGEVYMHGNTGNMESKATEEGCAVSELTGRTTNVAE